VTSVSVHEAGTGVGDPDNPHLLMVEAYAAFQYDCPMRRIKKIKLLGIHAQRSARLMLLLSRQLLSQKAERE